jgi:hypothetical protein
MCARIRKSSNKSTVDTVALFWLVVCMSRLCGRKDRAKYHNPLEGNKHTILMKWSRCPFKTLLASFVVFVLKHLSNQIYALIYEKKVYKRLKF